jgi:lysophospholipase L1-like esterase
MDAKTINRRIFLKSGALWTLGSFIPYVSLALENKKITLIGDTIREGYQDYVSLFLTRNSEVWSPDESEIHSVDILHKANRWLMDKSSDIIHINAGLEDIKCIPCESRKNLIPLEVYSDNIERIIKYIHLYQPGAIIIWATTTPVIDDKVKTMCQETKEFMIYHEDIIRYNEVMRGICERMGIPVNDLYQYVISGDFSRIMLEDGIHFTDRGYELLGEKVSDALNIFLH